MISISNNILIPERLIKSMPVVAVGGVLCMGVVVVVWGVGLGDGCVGQRSAKGCSSNGIYFCYFILVLSH